MHVRAIELAVLAAILCLWTTPTSDAAPAKFKLCSRELANFMATICEGFNGPPNDHSPKVVDPSSTRHRRALGIVDQCCNDSCELHQIAQYCESLRIPEPHPHMIEDRSAEGQANESATPPGIIARTSRRENPVSVASRAAPVVGTVSPLLTWGHTLHTEPTYDRDRYAYVAVFSPTYNA